MSILQSNGLFSTVRSSHTLCSICIHLNHACVGLGTSMCCKLGRYQCNWSGQLQSVTEISLVTGVLR